jgi:2-haloacid dehalogenase
MTVEGLVLDVNETLFSLAPLATRFGEAGLGDGQMDVWFARVLRDGFALAATDEAEAFPAIAAHHLRVLFRASGIEANEDAVAGVLGAFENVTPQPDVAVGLNAARDAGLAVATLTNGTAAITREFLERAGIDDLVDHVLAARASGVWKPHRRAYRWAAEQIGMAPERLALVAVHPWDVHGAIRAGLVGAWLDRADNDDEYPGYFRPPDVRGRSLPEVVEALRAIGPASSRT